MSFSSSLSSQSAANTKIEKVWAKKQIQNLSNASVVDLKAELFRTRDDYEKSKKTVSSDVFARVTSTKTFKKPPAGIGKTGSSSRSNLGKHGRADEEDEEENEEEEEMRKIQASWVVLQRKAQEYERLKRDASDTIEGGGGDDHGDGGEGEDVDDKSRHGFVKKTGNELLKEESLVDFVQKRLDKDSDDSDNDSDDNGNNTTSADPWVETTDEFGRTKIVRKSQLPKTQPNPSGLSSFVKATGVTKADSNSGPSLVSADMLREQERQRWEAEQKASLDTPPQPLHFDHRREIRTLGVGFYSFSQDNSERAREMNELNALRNSTVDSRVRAAAMKEERKGRLEARKAAIAAKRDVALQKRHKAEGGGGGGDVGGGVPEEEVDEFLKGIRSGFD